MTTTPEKQFLALIDEKLDQVLERPEGWGGMDTLEPVVLVLLMLRSRVADPASSERDVPRGTACHHASGRRHQRLVPHTHGERPAWVWEPPDGIPDRDPGEIRNQAIQVQGQGRVRSFLDLAAPDGTPRQQLYWAHEAILALGRVGAQFPRTVVSGPLFVRFELEFQLRNQWHHELHALLDAGLPLVP